MHPPADRTLTVMLYVPNAFGLFRLDKVILIWLVAAWFAVRIPEVMAKRLFDVLEHMTVPSSPWTVQLELEFHMDAKGKSTVNVDP